jgi:hypothetical protein
MTKMRASDFVLSFMSRLGDDPPDWVLKALDAQGFLPFRRTSARNTYGPLLIALWERALTSAKPDQAAYLIRVLEEQTATLFADAPSQLKAIRKDVAEFRRALNRGVEHDVDFRYAAQFLVHFVLGDSENPKHAKRIEALEAGIGRLYLGLITEAAATLIDR